MRQMTNCLRSLLLSKKGENMAEKNNSTCAICGKGYYLCLACKSKMNAEPWKLHTDTSEHFKLFQILRGYSNGVYTKAEMRGKFKKLDLKNYSSFRPTVKAQIDEILKEDKKQSSAIESDTVISNENRKVEKKENKIEV